MFKKVPHHISLPLNNNLPIFFFSNKTKTYVPMTPLTHPKFNLIYANNEFMKGSIIRPARKVFFWTPAILVGINNYLTQWSTLTTCGFVGLFLWGSLMHFKYKSRLFNQAQSIQISSDLQTFYIAVPESALAKIYSRNFFNNQQQSDFWKIQEHYHPLFNKFSKEQFEQMYEAIRSGQEKYRNKQYNTFTQEQFDKYFHYRGLRNGYKVFETCLTRYKITRDQIKQIKLDLQDKEKQRELQLDKQRLSLQQMMKKYEDTDILIQTKITIKGGKAVPLRVNMKDNGHRKSHDYLLAMALGYSIDPIVLATHSQ